MKEKSKYKNRILAITSMVLLILAFIIVGQRFFFRQGDPNQVRLQGFYLEDKDSLDLVILGSSEVYNDYSAAEAYRLSGITSYPFGLSSNSVSLWKYELAEIMKRQNPKILIVELNGACYDDSHLYGYAPLRNFSDSIPLSKNKIDLVNNMVEKVTDEDKLSFYMPIFKYHGELKHNPLTVLKPVIRGYNLLRGEFAHPGVIMEKHSKLHYIDIENKKLDLNPDAELYFNEFLDACDDANVEKILFVQFPHIPISKKAATRDQRYLTLEEMVTSRGYDFLNLSDLQDEIGLVVEEDYYDAEHLNARGQRKLTKWFINYLISTYDLEPTKLTEKQKREWDESAKYIEAFYEYYEYYLAEHPDKKTRVKALNENYRTIELLEEWIENEH